MSVTIALPADIKLVTSYISRTQFADLGSSCRMYLHYLQIAIFPRKISEMSDMPIYVWIPVLWRHRTGQAWFSGDPESYDIYG